MTRTVVVIGSSVGGVSAAQALRREGFEGRILLVGDEAAFPYDKPPLTKQFLAGDWEDQQLTLLTPEAAEHSGIELRLGTAATGLDVPGRRVMLADGTELTYDSLVVATGASARPSPWSVESGIHVIRTLEDSRVLRDALQSGGPVVVVGGGFIGSEVASTLWGLGQDVTVVDPAPRPMARVVGSEVGRYLTDLHHRHGVKTHFGTGVEVIDGVAGRLRVTLTDGTTLPAALVVVGIGAVPNDTWLADSRVPVKDGVLCDEFSRAIASPDVHVVGDVARWFHPDQGEYVRLEHWTNAVEQASCAAHNIMHPQDLAPYRPVEYVWSDQYGWRIQVVGRPAAGARLKRIGVLSGATPQAAFLHADSGTGRLCGAVTVNWPKALIRCRRFLREGATLDEACDVLGSSAPMLPRTDSAPLSSGRLSGVSDR